MHALRRRELVHAAQVLFQELAHFAPGKVVESNVHAPLEMS
jgi:hypothetical protein